MELLKIDNGICIDIDKNGILTDKQRFYNLLKKLLDSNQDILVMTIIVKCCDNNILDVEMKNIVLPLSKKMSEDEVYEIDELPGYFPCADCRFTNVSKYSTTPLDQSELTSKLVYQIYEDEDITVYDAYACIGGNSWSFSRRGYKVIATEKNQLHRDILEYNMRNIGAQVDIVGELANYEIKADVAFVDPPWGGRDYKNARELQLLPTEDFKRWIDNYDTTIFKLPMNHKIINHGHGHKYFKKIVFKNERGVPKYMLLIYSKRDISKLPSILSIESRQIY